MVVLDVERPDNIGNSITVQHACGRDITGGPGGQVHNPTRLPVFRQPRPDSMRTAEQELAGSDRQSKRTVVDQSMLAVSGCERVVTSTIRGIRVDSARPIWSLNKTLPQIPAPGIGSLRTHAGNRPKRNLSLQRMVIGMAKVGFQNGAAELWIGLD